MTMCLAELILNHSRNPPCFTVKSMKSSYNLHFPWCFPAFSQHRAVPRRNVTRYAVGVALGERHGGELPPGHGESRAGQRRWLQHLGGIIHL